MGESNNGLTNAAYAIWLSETAIQDCAAIEELYIKYTDNSDEIITDNEEIYNLMDDADADEVATFKVVRFSGHDEEEEPWFALDERLSVNLERMENYAGVPANIRRPTGG